MEVESSYIRSDMAQKCQDVGFNYYNIDDEIYWDESHCYRFTEKEVDDIDDIATELHKLAIEATQDIIVKGDYEKYNIPVEFAPIIEQSWNRGDKHLYGRMDLAKTSDNEFKLLEYNADTPTSLLEASIVQWDWLCDTHPTYDQFNSIHEKLIARWREVYRGVYPIHFACQRDILEDINTIEYLMRTAEEANLNVAKLFMDEIGYHDSKFIDLNNDIIKVLFKLYPSEWLLEEEFSQYIIPTKTQFIEPIWKVITSSKSILVKMWEMNPNHPNLLATYFTPDQLKNYVRKPVFSREGANIEIDLYGGNIASTEGLCGAPFVYQQYCPLPKFNDSYTLIGSWVIGDESAGIGIREDSTLITCNTSRFIPHYF